MGPKKIFADDIEVLGRSIEKWRKIRSYVLLYAMYASMYAYDLSCMLFIILCARVLVFRVVDYPPSVW